MKYSFWLEMFCFIGEQLDKIILIKYVVLNDVLCIVIFLDFHLVQARYLTRSLWVSPIIWMALKCECICVSYINRKRGKKERERSSIFPKLTIIISSFVSYCKNTLYLYQSYSFLREKKMNWPCVDSVKCIASEFKVFLSFLNKKFW